MTEAFQAPARRRGRPRLAERNIDMRAAAIEAARQICTDPSEGGFTMERVARAMQMRTPSLYHHFPGGRSELILALADHCSAADGDAIARIVADENDPLACFRMVARYFAKAIERHPYRQITDLREDLPPPTREKLQATFADRIERPLTRLIEHGIERKQFRGIDPEIFVRAFLTLMLDMKVFEIADDKRHMLPDLLVDLLMEGALVIGPDQ